MFYKAAIIDVDGTALNSPEEQQASERLARATADLVRQGMKVCIATGRSRMSAQPVLDSMRIRQPAILSGGARIVDCTSGKELWRRSLEPSQLNAIVEAARTCRRPCLWNEYSEQDYLHGGRDIAELDSDRSVYFFEICFAHPMEATEIVAELTKLEGIAATATLSQKPGLVDIHITGETATKEYSAHELQNILGVSREETIGVGDGYNDLHLFRAVGHRVAMGNAVDALKQVSDEIIDDVWNDGLAKYFEHLARGE